MALSPAVVTHLDRVPWVTSAPARTSRAGSGAVARHIHDAQTSTNRLVTQGACTQTAPGPSNGLERDEYPFDATPAGPD
ncbi:hypothetical protein [Streptomyces sp. NPDC002573]|uniref:hypothetical protein n=1 Tax=Streptomyces sp. NPDC002573 TaxID=3364651 RepID=UPI00368827D2